MANFTRQRAPLAWTLGSVVLPTEFDEIDARWVKVPNFADGSTHAPTLPIIIGGSGLQVTGGFEAYDVELLTVLGAVNFSNGSELNFADTVTVTVDDGTWFFTDTSTIHLTNSGITLTTGSDITVQTGALAAFESGSALSVALGTIVNIGAVVDIAASGSIILAAGSTIEAGPLQIDTNGISMSGGSWATATGLLTLTKRLVLSGSDAGVTHRIGTVANANDTIDVSCDEWLVPKALTATRTYTLRHTTSPIPTTGQRMKVSRLQPITSGADFRSEGGTQLALIAGDGSAGGWVEFTYDSARGGWRATAWGGNATVSPPDGGTY